MKLDFIKKKWRVLEENTTGRNILHEILKAENIFNNELLTGLRPLEREIGDEERWHLESLRR